MNTLHKTELEQYFKSLGLEHDPAARVVLKGVDMLEQKEIPWIPVVFSRTVINGDSIVFALESLRPISGTSKKLAHILQLSPEQDPAEYAVEHGLLFGRHIPQAEKNTFRYCWVHAALFMQNKKPGCAERNGSSRYIKVDGGLKFILGGPAR